MAYKLSMKAGFLINRHTFVNYFLCFFFLPPLLTLKIIRLTTAIPEESAARTHIAIGLVSPVLAPAVSLLVVVAALFVLPVVLVLVLVFVPLLVPLEVVVVFVLSLVVTD